MFLRHLSSKNATIPLGGFVLDWIGINNPSMFDGPNRLFEWDCFLRIVATDLPLHDLTLETEDFVLRLLRLLLSAMGH